MLTAKSVYAIEQVLLMNSDICDLYEERGVSREDLRAVFKLASEQTPVDAKKGDVIVRINKKLPKGADYEIADVVARELGCESAFNVKVIGK